MITRNTYSRFILSVSDWNSLKKGPVIELLDHSVEHGITTFDCCDFSGKKVADSTFGIALSESGLSRDEIQLVSKIVLKENSKEHLINTVDELLLTLKTDYLDLLLLELPHHIPEVIDGVAQLSSQGKILEIGGLGLNLLQIENLENFVPVRANQLKFPFSGDFEEETTAYASKKIAPFVWYLPEKTSSEKREAFKFLAIKYGLSIYNLILAWMLQHPAYLHVVLLCMEQEKIAGLSAVKKTYIHPADWQKIALLLNQKE